MFSMKKEAIQISEVVMRHMNARHVALLSLACNSALVRRSSVYALRACSSSQA